jgi:tryptophan 2,3-dioxygenase
MSIAWTVGEVCAPAAGGFVSPDGHLDVVSLGEHVRRVGKAQLDPELCAALEWHRALLPSDDLLARAVLDCVLDIHDGRYFYGSYIAAPVLALVDPTRPGRCQTLLQVLLADAALHDLASLDSGTGLHELPGVSLVAKRARHAARLVAGLGGRDLPPALGDPLASRRWFADVRAQAGAALGWLGVDVISLLSGSVLPVDTYHDEYLFLRVLQCYETVFCELARLMAAAVAQVGDGDPAAAAAIVDSATQTLSSVSGLFRLLATMQVSSFQAFRQKTDGASAIQSESYKYFESTCAPPSAERIAATAYDQVPLTRAHLITGRATLQCALRRQVKAMSTADAAALVAAMRRLDDEHTAWRVTHVGMAARFLAGARGSGDTEGLPYLERVRSLRLFHSLPEVAS